MFHDFLKEIISLDFSNLFADPPIDLEVAQFVENKFGNKMLMNKMGHVYSINSRSKDGTKIYWTCRERKLSKGNNKCIARGVTRDTSVLQWSGEHNHEVLSL